MRNYLHRQWYQRIWKEIAGYLRDKYGLDWFKLNCCKRSNKLWLELEILHDCLCWLVNLDWRDWSSGSTLYFWRWTSDFLEGTRDGIQVFRVDEGPHYWVPQQSEGDAAKRALIAKKLQKVLDRGYVKLGKVLSLTGYFVDFLHDLQHKQSLNKNEVAIILVEWLFMLRMSMVGVDLVGSCSVLSHLSLPWHFFCGLWYITGYE
jgi:hypothetical protein